MNWRTGLAASAFMLSAIVTAHAQAVCANPTKLDGFSTCADVAKAEQEGALVVYTTDPEDGTAAMLAFFHKTFPKIETNYIRLQAGALYAR
jgi:iron(III) transport system substrate-binding protein